MRFAYEPIPWLSTAAAPQVSATTGLGTGGGAGVNTPDGTGFGAVAVTAGSGAATSGSVVLKFAANPPTLFISGDEAFGTITSSGQGTTSVTISWTGANLIKSKRYRLNYEWSVST